MKISIIIPVYNGEKFITACYENICSQNYTNWEAIFINDGSSDNSLTILRSIEKSDKRVVVEDQQNQGVVKARQKGVEVAKGEIITFLDIDDSFTPRSLELMSTCIQKYDCDVMIGGFNIVTSSQISNKIEYIDQLCDQNKAFTEVCHGTIRWQLWAKCYKKSLFNDIIHPYELKIGEDMVVLLQVLLKASRVKITNALLYNYTLNPQSVMQQQFSSKNYDSLKASDVAAHLLLPQIEAENIKNSLKEVALLSFSSILSAGLPNNDPIGTEFIKRNYSFTAIKKISFLKACAITLYRIFNFNVINRIRR